MRIRSNIFSVILAASGIVLMIFGAGRGEIFLVFNKAIRICLECIGIG